MKKYKLFGSLFMVVGCIATISTSLALSIFGGDVSVNVDIGSASTSDGITYTASKVEEPSNQLELSGSNSHKFSFKLGANISSSSEYTQSWIVGKFDITISGDIVKYLSYIDYKKDDTTYKVVEAKLNGYNNDSYFNKNNSTYRFYFDEKTNALSLTNEYLVVYNSGQELSFELKVDSSKITKDVISTLGGSSYNVNANWSAPGSDYEFAYIVGSPTAWNKTLKYRMVPDIEEPSKWQWTLRNISFNSGDEIKAQKGETWSTGDNYKINENGKYNMYYVDSSDVNKLYVSKVSS